MSSGGEERRGRARRRRREVKTKNRKNERGNEMKLKDNKARDNRR